MYVDLSNTDDDTHWTQFHVMVKEIIIRVKVPLEINVFRGCKNEKF